jgi:hypothetical protein
VNANLAYHLQVWLAYQVMGTFYILLAVSGWRACGAQHAGRRAKRPWRP